jgi:hypothetical protein
MGFSRTWALIKRYIMMISNFTHNLLVLLIKVSYSNDLDIYDADQVISQLQKLTSSACDQLDQVTPNNCLNLTIIAFTT